MVVPFSKRALIERYPKADSSKRGEQVAGVAEGELEHSRSFLQKAG